MRGRDQLAIGALLCIIATLVVMDALNWSLFRGHFEADTFGTVAAWVSGLLTAGSVLIATRALLEDRRKVAAEALRLERAREVEQRDAAAAIESAKRDTSMACWAWLTKRVDYSGRTDAILLNVVNETGLPVYEWSAATPDGFELATDAGHGPVIPGPNVYEIASSGPSAHATDRTKLEFRFTTRFHARICRHANGELSEEGAE